MSGLHVNNLSHAFGGEDVVRGVSVFVAPGELVCLLGPSGCGKTTLLRVAAGLEPLQRGQVRIGEEIMADGAGGLQVPPEKRGIGLMFQDYALFPHLSVEDNILFGVRDISRRRDWLAAALEQMDLTQHAASFPHTLSGGQQQRVALLRAMAPGPRVLFLDEPFSGLDVTRRASVREQALGLLKETGVATLMVTHDPEEAMFMADRIVVMDQGRMVQDGVPVDIYFHPVNAFVADLFGPVNRFRGRVSEGAVDTPFGRIEAGAVADGQVAEVLIRPEAFRLTRPGDRPREHPGDAPCRPAAPGNGSPALTELDAAIGTRFEVVSARPLGRASHVVFLVSGGDTGTARFEARVPGVYLPEPGTTIEVSVNTREAHVFPQT